MAGAKTMVKPGTLYGVGVGPGDPELMTVKAWRLITSAQVIAYLAANGGESTARNIAAPFFEKDVVEIIIDMPMKLDREIGKAAYDRGAAQIAASLADGRDVVVLCEGDPFFYGSFMYLFERLSPQFTTIVVPGITSISAAAAEMRVPLAARDDVLKILPATLPAEQLRTELTLCRSAAIIKVGRHFEKVKSVLSELGLVNSATSIEYATHGHQVIRKLGAINETTLPYFTTIIVRP
jgi:precorrin-2/cobalt-factor-2 C20-methyltransferase